MTATTNQAKTFCFPNLSPREDPKAVWNQLGTDVSVLLWFVGLEVGGRKAPSRGVFHAAASLLQLFQMSQLQPDSPRLSLHSMHKNPCFVKIAPLISPSLGPCFVRGTDQETSHLWLSWGEGKGPPMASQLHCLWSKKFRSKGFSKI